MNKCACHSKRCGQIKLRPMELRYQFTVTRACVIGGRVKFSLFQYFFHYLSNLYIGRVSKMAFCWNCWQITDFVYIQLATTRWNGVKDIADSSKASKNLKNRQNFNTKFDKFKSWKIMNKGKKKIRTNFWIFRWR